MNVFLPELYPDELVYSWFSRFLVHEGYITNIHVLEALFCDKQNDDPSKEFVGKLNQATREYIEKTYSMKNIVLNHTMYPFYTRFIPLDQRKDALYKLCYENHNVQNLIPISARCDNEKFLKYCPLCAQRDRELYGETYWHRMHQIRNIMICPKHHCQLINSSVFISNKTDRLLQAAENMIPDKLDNIIIEKNQLQINFTKYVEEIFYEPVNLENDISIPVILHHFIRNTKYKKENRYHYTSQFYNDIRTYYTDNVHVNEIISKCRIQNLMLGTTYDFSAIVQIGFFLNIHVNELLHLQLTQQQVKEEKELHYKNIEPDWESYDSQMATTVEKIAYDVYYGYTNKYNKPEKVMIKKVCEKADIQIHHIKHMTKCLNAIGKYQESYPELWARRLVWAYNILESEKGEENFYWIELQKLSGVVKANFNQIKPCLEIFTDQNTINKIIKVMYPKKS